MASSGTISRSHRSTQLEPIQGVSSSGECFIRKDNYRIKSRKEIPITASLTGLPLMQEACLLLTVSGLNSLVGTIQDFGCGEEKTLSSPSKFGCAEVGQSGCPAQGLLTCTEDTLARHVTAAP